MVVESIAKIIRDKSAIKANDKLDGEAFPVFKLFREEFELIATTIVETTGVGNSSFILGHNVNGILGTSPLGLGTTTDTIVRVINSNDAYIELFNTETMIDSSSTGTFGTNDYVLGTSEFIKSEIIFRNQVNIISAIINIDYTGNSPTLIELSNDDGVTWESSVSNVINTFLSTGQVLRYRITGTGTTITKIKVRYVMV